MRSLCLDVVDGITGVVAVVVALITVADVTVGIIGAAALVAALIAVADATVGIIGAAALEIDAVTTGIVSVDFGKKDEGCHTKVT